jgi:hypothetical protein
MFPWHTTYPASKVTKLNNALARGFDTTLSDKDVSDTLQRSTSAANFAKNLIEMYSLSIELEKVIALCNSTLT